MITPVMKDDHKILRASHGTEFFKGETMWSFEIDEALVSNLISGHFPQWKDIPVAPMVPMGHDNRTFRLGDELLVRLPSDPGYVPHIPVEILCLQNLQPYLQVKVPQCVAAVEADELFPAPWTVNRYLPGETVTHSTVTAEQECVFALELRKALQELQSAPDFGAPAAGAHNCYRGAHPSVYEAEAKQAMEKWKAVLPVKRLAELWACAMNTQYTEKPVWVHGDVAPGNMLVENGHLSALIDFGTSAIGDPACDDVMAWTFFSGEARKAFLQGLTEDRILRAKAWAMWKALISFDGDLTGIHARTIDNLLE